MVVAILIAGAYAFLSATDSKTNVFTVGNVDIELHEIFNGKDYGKGEDPGAIGDKIENIVPGQSIEKAPYVVNTGKNPAYTFIAVGIPTDTSANVYNGQGTYTAKTELDIKVKAYAIQQQYNGATDAESTWTNYFKNDMISGTASDAGIELFTLNNGTSAVTTGTHTIGSDWQEFSTPYSVNDGGNTYTYHFFKYVANNELLPVGTTTAHLFDKVVFNENIGGKEPPKPPVTLSYIAPEESSSTLAGDVNLADTNNIPEGYVLLKTETYLPGSKVTTLYFDDTLAKTGYLFNWGFMNDKTKSAYSGMTITKDTTLVPSYVKTSEIASTPDYLAYTLDFRGTNTPQELSATLSGADKTVTSFPSETTGESINVPAYITLVKNGSQVSLKNGVLLTIISESTTEYINKLKDGSYQIPVRQVGNPAPGYEEYGNALKQITKELYISDTVEEVSDIFSGSEKLEALSLPYKNVLYRYNCFAFCSQLNKVICPQVLKTISAGMFRGCNFSTISIPEGVEIIESDAFQYCNNINQIILPETIQRIEKGAFDGSGSINELYIPSGTIAQEAFSLPNLNKIKLGPNVTNIQGGSIKTYGEIYSILVDNKNSVYDSRNDCNAIIETEHNELVMACEKTDLSLCSNIEVIGAHAFDWSQISTSQNIVLPQFVREIKNSAFVQAYWLTGIVLPESLEIIGEDAFASCYELKTIVIPQNVKQIGQGAFGTTAIEKIKVSPENKLYDSRNDCNAIMETATNKLVQACKNTVIPQETKIIGTKAYYGIVQQYPPVTPVYAGTILQWKNIIISEFNNLSGLTIQCADGTVTVE